MAFLNFNTDDEKNHESILSFKVQSNAPRISFKQAIQRYISRDPGQFVVRYEILKRCGRGGSCDF